MAVRNGEELRPMYPACHTMDCAQAMERILEAKEITLYNDIEKQYRVFRRIRASGPKSRPHAAEENR